MESLSDIETELRTLSQSSKYCELQPTVSGKPISFYFAEIADRIKAAARTTEKSSAVGNAAAVREALKKARLFIGCSLFKVVEVNFGYLDRDELCTEIDAALSAPARNCDRFVDETDAQIAFLNEVWLISVTKETALERDRFENWTDEMRSRYAKWLLAPEAEQKGEGE